MNIQHLNLPRHWPAPISCIRLSGCFHLHLIARAEANARDRKAAIGDWYQPEAVMCGNASEDCSWPNSVGHDQRTSQSQSAQLVNQTSIRKTTGFRSASWPPPQVVCAVLSRWLLARSNTYANRENAELGSEQVPALPSSEKTLECDCAEPMGTRRK